MKNCGILFLFFGVVSCHLISPDKEIKGQLVEAEKQHINWEDLDQYPLFENCDETAGKVDRKNCFEKTFSRHLEIRLQQYEIVVHESMNDTLWIHLHIGNQGEIELSHIEKNEKIQAAIPQLDSILKKSIKGLPKLYPPLKRNIPVAAKFKLPVVLYVE